MEKRPLSIGTERGTGSMSRRMKVAMFGLLTGIIGLVASVSPIGSYLEESVGLHLLFQMRGVRKVPAEVIVVAMDQESAKELNLQPEPARWPRSLHARLVEKLAEGGAAVIAFDVLFDEPRLAEQDALFARAIHRACNVILCDALKKNLMPLTDESGARRGEVSVEQIVPPIPVLEQAAVASAPFPLPKVPHRVSQYWTFKTGGGDKPTLPVMAFQVFALDLYDEFIHFVKITRPHQAVHLPENAKAIIEKREIQFMQDLRYIVNQDPGIVNEIFEKMDSDSLWRPSQRDRRLLKSLLKMYQGGNSRYLNFYGPPGTVMTIPYHKVLQSTAGRVIVNGRPVDLKGKAVFVGFASTGPPEQRDGFFTIFSQDDGTDLSGVEIAATAFGNLLEDRHIEPLPGFWHFTIVFIWGLTVGTLSRRFPTLLTALTTAGLSIVYLGIVHHRFAHAAVWHPLAVPLFIQAPVAFLAALICSYCEVKRERGKIMKAFCFYIPENVVEKLVDDATDLREDRQLVHGACLCTDGEQYSRLSENMNPEELSCFLNRYYETIFQPVKSHGGVVSDIIGDSMFAVWVGDPADTALRIRACSAALDIMDAVARFNASCRPTQLPTRIGLHFGSMSLGNIGGVDHYEYRPVGDTVNTASRIEGLNKRLGTRILVSDEVVAGLHCFLIRTLGRFLLEGKSRPVVIHELMDRAENAGEEQKRLCEVFAEALAAYEQRYWKEAVKRFRESLKLSERDGPARFYLALCEQFRRNPPRSDWEGLIRLKK